MHTLKKLGIWMVIGLLSAVYIVSLQPDWMRQLTDWRFMRDSPLSAGRMMYGDLYYFCYLPQFDTPFDLFPPQRPACNRERDLVLVSFHDSYLNQLIHAGHFCRTDDYRPIHWEKASTAVALEKVPGKKYVLLLETTERYARMRFSSFDGFRKVYFEKSAPKQAVAVTATNIVDETISWKKRLFNPNIEQNLELNLFDYRPFWPAWSQKAAINWNLFERKDSNVVISPDGSRLYLGETLRAGSNTASNNPLPDSEVDSIVQRLNRVRDYYLDMGFDEVVLSVVPNPVQLIDPQMLTYNGFVPKLQQHPKLQIPFLDMYSIFEKDPKKYFQMADSHWNTRGLQRWSDELNQFLSGL